MIEISLPVHPDCAASLVKEEREKYSNEEVVFKISYHAWKSGNPVYHAFDCAFIKALEEETAARVAAEGEKKSAGPTLFKGML